MLTQNKWKGSVNAASKSEMSDKDNNAKLRPTQAQVLIELASDAQLFHICDHECFASFSVNNHTETWPIRSGSFRRYLTRLFYEQERKPPSRETLEGTLRLMEAKAQFEGETLEVFTRIGGDRDHVYLDLANEQWTVVEITRDGWRIVRDPAVKFRRSHGMLPLPDPVHGGSLEALRPLINAKDEETWILDVAWLIACLNPTGPYPVDITLGEQGSAKSTRQRLKRSIIDPIKAPLRSAPRNGRDLMISAKNGWVITLDNLSQLPDWLSDALCRLATGGGFSTRELYTNDEEMIFESCRPIAMNAIENMVQRADLVDRALISNIKPIPPGERRTEKELLSQFEEARPKILGALLDAVSMAFRNYDSVELRNLPRMADFAQWVVAAEPALPWPNGKFLDVYSQNRSGAIKTSLEGDPLASAIRTFMENQQEWAGTPTELYKSLGQLVGEKTEESGAWPKSAAWLTRKLKRPASFLRSLGVDIQFPEDNKKGKDRIITIKVDQEVNRQDVQNTVDAASGVEDTHNPPEEEGVRLLMAAADKTTLSTAVENMTPARNDKTSDATDAIDAKKQPSAKSSGEAGETWEGDL